MSWPAAFSGRLGTGAWPKLAFALRTTFSSFLALYLAFGIGLDDPKWAAMTVWIVAQPNRGMSLSKGLYRGLGTVAGAAIGVALIALFAQAPALLLAGLVLWLSGCTAIAVGLRNFRAYGAVMAGYTAAIIVADASADPSQVFDIAAARVVFIGLGVGVEAIVTAILAPGDAGSAVRRRLGAYLAQVQGVASRALKGESVGPSVHKLFAGAMDLGNAVEYAAASSVDVRRQVGNLRAATAGALAELATAHMVREHLAGTSSIDGLIDGVSSLLAADTPLPERIVRARHLHGEVEQAIEAARKAPTASVTPSLVVLNRLARLLVAQEETLLAQQRIAAGKPARGPRPAFHVDARAAWIGCLRAGAALIAASLFWLATGWSNGAGFVVIVGVVCGLFATRPNGATSAAGFLRGAAVAALAAALVNFWLLPQVTSFTGLVLVMGGFMVLGGWFMQDPRYAAPAAAFAIFFWDLISPDNATRVDAGSFFNGVVSLLAGILCGGLAFTLLFPARPDAARQRLHRAMRNDLRAIATSPGRWSREAWLSRTADRLARQLATAALVGDDVARAEFRGLLAAWTIGDVALELQDFGRRGDRPLSRIVAAMLRALADGDLLRAGVVARRGSRRQMRIAREDVAGSRQSAFESAILLTLIADSAAAHAEIFAHAGRGRH